MTRALVLVLLPSLAWADDPPAPAPAAPTGEPIAAPLDEPAPAPDPQPAPVSEPVVAPKPDELAAELDAVYEQQRKLEAQNLKQAARIEELEKLTWLGRDINLFVDVGAYAVGGDGSGIRPDINHNYFPHYIGRVAGQWVFMGDPLSTSVNSLGEPADTSTSREIEKDTINSGGQPSLIVNTIGLTISKYVKINDERGFTISTFARLLPRPDDTIFDVELATIGYRPLRETNLLLEVGKIESVLGVEYRVQDATKRKGVTPSLICRYTCGRPLGARAHLTLGPLIASTTLANGQQLPAAVRA